MSSYDRAFGPRVSPSRRAFDFTLYFEDLFFAALPASAFILLLPTHVYALSRRPGIVKRSRFLASKSLVFLALLVCQTVFLALRCSNPQIQTRASLAADVLSLVATIGAAFLSWFDHHRSLRPSTLLALYLSALLLVGIPRLRTLWYIPDDVSAATSITINFGLTLLALVLESLNKGGNLRWPSKYAELGAEPFSGFWKRVGFVWLIATMREGYQKVLTVDDLPGLDIPLRSHDLHIKLQDTWARYDVKKKNSLVKACFRAYAGAFLGAVMPRLFLSGFTYAQPFMISTLTQFVQDKAAPEDYGRGIIGAYALVYLGMAASTSVYWYQTFRFLIQLRGGLVSIIYQQTVQGRAVDEGEITGLTLMGTDVDRIMAGFRSIHEVWASLLDITVAIYLLERQLQVACLIPAAITLGFVLATFKLSSWAKTSQRQWIERVEKRLSVTSSMLKDMKALKMLGLSNKMFDIIDKLQHIELEKSSNFRKNLICQVFFSNSPSMLAPVVTFAVYVAIGSTQDSGSLLATRVFTSLSLITLLTTSALTFIQAIPSMIQCLSCFDRIQEYCRHSFNQAAVEGAQKASLEMSRKDAPDKTITLQNMAHVDTRNMSASNPCMISFQNQAFGWTKTGPAVLQIPNLQIKLNMVTVILGPTASGKSTLLESIIGETVALSGWTERDFPSAAYCSQKPWLINGTIRENIIGASPVNEDWYTSVLYACALQADLVLLRGGDQTEVGSDGMNLSGGQKQRISLARAVYSKCKVMLLDDILSGVDSHNIGLISSRLFGASGVLRRHQITVVLATHTSALLTYTDEVIVLKEGRVVETGSVNSLREAGGYVADLDFEGPSDASEVSQSQDTCDPPVAPTRVANALSVFRQRAIDLKRTNGDFAVYGFYSRAAGHSAVVAFLAFMVLWAFCENFSTVWLDWWSDADTRNPRNDKVGLYLGIYAFLGIGATILMLAACWFLFMTMITNSIRRLHRDLLGKTLGYHPPIIGQGVLSSNSLGSAPLRFFYETDTGSLTNRFSQDIELIGMDFPLMAINYISAACNCIAQAIILAIFARYLAITLPFVVGIVFMIQKFYLRTSRQVRLLDIEAKAPVYLHFLESTSGAATIRAFGWELPFNQSLKLLLDRSQRAVYLLYCVQQWLALVLDMIVAALAVILVATVVTWRSSFGAGHVGVALVMIMTFNRTLMSVVKYWTMLETSVGAVSRIKAFVEATASEEGNSEEVALPRDWPASGHVEYNNVVASYALEADPALKRISLSIKPGERLAICGHSGSGKTSLILSLLKMIDVQSGSIILDGTDISRLLPVQLRQRINVVPQDPFLMPGSIRFNLDPYQSAPDDVIVRALSRLGLWKAIKSEGGLDKEIDTASWSAGERQLLCLARAMLRKSPLLILDEATSSVDPATEAIMQDVIDTEFAGCTVLAVIHRLGFIRQFDKVVILKGGELVEYGTPNTLLAEDSRLAGMYRAGGYESS